jgi:putative FmdB family regulatory protein
MPLYDLKCPKCGHQEELVCPMDERNKQVCEKCKELLEVQIGRVTAVWNCDCPTASGGRACDE